MARFNTSDQNFGNDYVHWSKAETSPNVSPVELPIIIIIIINQRLLGVWRSATR